MRRETIHQLFEAGTMCVQALDLCYPMFPFQMWLICDIFECTKFGQVSIVIFTQPNRGSSSSFVTFV